MFGVYLMSNSFSVGIETPVAAVKEERASDVSVDSRVPLRYVNTLDQQPSHQH